MRQLWAGPPVVWISNTLKPGPGALAFVSSRHFRFVSLSFCALIFAANCYTLRTETKFKPGKERVLEDRYDEHFFRNSYKVRHQLSHGFQFDIEAWRITRKIKTQLVEKRGTASRDLSQDRDGSYQVHSHFFFSWNRSRVESVEQYLLLNTLFAIPSLGLSLVAMTLDLGTLPFRTLDYEYRDVTEEKVWQRYIRKPVQVTGTLDCDGLDIEIVKNHCKAAIAAQRNAPWKSFRICTLPGMDQEYFWDLSETDPRSRPEAGWLVDIALDRQPAIRQELKETLLQGLQHLERSRTYDLHPHSRTRFCAMARASIYFLEDESLRSSLESRLAALCDKWPTGKKSVYEYGAPLREMLRELETTTISQAARRGNIPDRIVLVQRAQLPDPKSNIAHGSCSSLLQESSDCGRESETPYRISGHTSYLESFKADSGAPVHARMVKE